MRNLAHGLFRWSLSSMICLVILAGCGGKIPAPVLGTWVTEDKRYEDRALHITSDAITFLAEEDGRSTGSIRKVRINKQETWNIIKVTYVDKDDDPRTVELVYSPQYGGMLWFKNQSGVVWRKVNPAGAGGNSRDRPASKEEDGPRV